MQIRKQSALAAATCVLAVGVVSCDDPPVTSQVGGLVVMFRTFPATSGKFALAERIEVAFNRVEVVHSPPGSEAEQRLVVDTQPRSLTIHNAVRDVVIGQYPVPLGTVKQVRLFATGVTLHQTDGVAVPLEVSTPDLPSWRQSGWKIASEAGEVFPVLLDELTGMRALFRFDNRLVRPQGKGSTGWKIKPTVDAERFEVNPPPEGGGVFFDQLTVVFHEGVSRERISELNAAIGATVLISPRLTTWYRVKLPATTNLEVASAYYRGLPEVQALLPATNFATLLTDANDDDSNTSRLDLVTARNAWDTSTGSHAVRVAVIDTGVDYTHPDLYRNIAINQGELPPGLFDTDSDGTVEAAEIATFDLDPPGIPDGVISIRDLEAAAAGSPLIPADANGNGRIDGFDLIRDANWADGANDDGNGITAADPVGFVDDLIGWDFSNGDNDPMDGAGHGTVCAGIIGAEGNNGLDVAGLNWRASIVPVRASVGINFVPDVRFSDAVRYVEALGVDVVNVSQGWHFAHEDLDYRCGRKDVQTTGGISGGTYGAGLADANTAYAGLFGAASALWVFAAGNSAYDVDDSRLTVLPQEAALLAAPNNVLIVGAVGGSPGKSGFSSYGQTSVHLYATGEDWVGLRVGGGTSPDWDGTSFSAPTVAGAATLLAAGRPAFRGNASAIRQTLIDTSTVSVAVSCDGSAHTGRLLDANAAIGVASP